MIEAKKERYALRAIQDLICHGRKMAYEGITGDRMAKFMDDLEYLPALMLEISDKTDFFEEYLKGICLDFDCNYIVVWYEKRLKG
jgi:hypothetical protein